MKFEEFIKHPLFKVDSYFQTTINGSVGTITKLTPSSVSVYKKIDPSVYEAHDYHFLEFKVLPDPKKYTQYIWFNLYPAGFSTTHYLSKETAKKAASRHCIGRVCVKIECTEGQFDEEPKED